MSYEEIVKIILPALLGSGGIVGVFMYYIKKYIDKAITAAETRQEERKKEQMQATLDDLEWQDAFSKWAYWLQKGITRFDVEHKYWNGECQSAFDRLNKVEKHKKERNNQIIAEHKLEN